MRGLTLAQVAERSGLNLGYLSQIENDKASPSLAVLGTLAAALDVPPAWFLMDDVPPPTVVRAAERPVVETELGRIEHVDGRGSRDVSIIEVTARPGGRIGAPRACRRRAPHRAARPVAGDPGRARDRRRTGRLRPLGRLDPARRRGLGDEDAALLIVRIRATELSPARTIDGVTRRAVTYASYLKVPELLALQVERSTGRTAARAR